MGKKSDTERLKRITYNTKVICTLRSLEKGTATHSSILAWRIPRTVWYGVAESDTTEQLLLHLIYDDTFYPGPLHRGPLGAGGVQKAQSTPAARQCHYHTARCTSLRKPLSRKIPKDKQKAKRNWTASWWKWKTRVEKVGLILSIQRAKIMAPSPFTSWQRGGNSGNGDWLFLGSKVTADGDGSHGAKTLLLGREAMTNLHSIFKSTDITLPAKVRLVKAMVFPVVTYGCESWTIKKTEHQRIDAIELWCWKRLSRVPWTAGRSNQSILKEISPGCLLEGLMLRLKF